MADDGNDFLQKLAAALAAAGGGIAGKALANNGSNPLTSNVPPQLSQLLDIGVQRQAFSNPLYEATTRGTYAMLPTFAKEGTQLSGGLSSAIPAPTTGGGGTGGGGAGVAGGVSLAALAGLLASGSGGETNLQKIIDKIKGLFHRGKDGEGADTNEFTGPMDQPGVGAPDWSSFPGYGTAPDYLLSDPGTFYDQNGRGATPTDPSGGTGVGPGMRDYRENPTALPSRDFTANWNRTGPTDPSGGSGVGPGMLDYYRWLQGK